MQNQILFVDAVAQMLACTPKQVEDMWREKKLPGTKAGRSWFVTEVALFEALDEICGQNFLRPATPEVAVPLGVKVADTKRAAANSRRFNATPPALPDLPSKQAVG